MVGFISGPHDGEDSKFGGASFEGKKQYEWSSTLEKGYVTNEAINILVLGAGQDVGRSCVLVQMGGRNILFDCGYHLGFSDERRYPNFNLLCGSSSPMTPGMLGKNSAALRGESLVGPYVFPGSSQLTSISNEKVVSYEDGQSQNEKNRKRRAGFNYGAHTSLSQFAEPESLFRDALTTGASQGLHLHADRMEHHQGENHYLPSNSFGRNLFSINPRLNHGKNEATQENKLDLNLLVDCVIVTHLHLDHCGALPFFTEKLGYKGPIFMTYPTKALSPILLVDSSKAAFSRWERKRMEHQAYLYKMKQLESQAIANPQANREIDGITPSHPGKGLFTHAAAKNPSFLSVTRNDPWNYSNHDVSASMKNVVVLQLQETFEFGDIFITPYYAGHVLGACIFSVRVGDKSVVYTGDYNTISDRHLGPAIVPRLRPDLLISESTYASYVRQSKRAIEREFCSSIQTCLDNGGKVLIPVFAVGRAQELCILVEQHWEKMNLSYPIYFGGGMTEKANKYYQVYASWTLSAAINSVADSSASFEFPHIDTFQSHFLQEDRPMVLFATPGMLNGGLALRAFKEWAPEAKNLIVIPGYCVYGTVGNKLISGERLIKVDANNSIAVKCKVRYMSFSAHADSIGIQEIIRQVSPANVILVHGEKDGMEKLARFLRKDLRITVQCPANGQRLAFKPSNAQYSTFPNAWVDPDIFISFPSIKKMRKALTDSDHKSDFSSSLSLVHGGSKSNAIDFSNVLHGPPWRSQSIDVNHEALTSRNCVLFFFLMAHGLGLDPELHKRNNDSVVPEASASPGINVIPRSVRERALLASHAKDFARPTEHMRKSLPNPMWKPNQFLHGSSIPEQPEYSCVFPSGKDCVERFSSLAYSPGPSIPQQIYAGSTFPPISLVVASTETLKSYAWKKFWNCSFHPLVTTEKGKKMLLDLLSCKSNLPELSSTNLENGNQRSGPASAVLSFTPENILVVLYRLKHSLMVTLAAPGKINDSKLSFLEDAHSICLSNTVCITLVKFKECIQKFLEIEDFSRPLRSPNESPKSFSVGETRNSLFQDFFRWRICTDDVVAFTLNSLCGIYFLKKDLLILQWDAQEDTFGSPALQLVEILAPECPAA